MHWTLYDYKSIALFELTVITCVSYNNITNITLRNIMFDCFKSNDVIWIYAVYYNIIMTSTLMVSIRAQNMYYNV